MLCPHCNQSLVTRKVKGHDTELDYCNLCKAAWFDRGELPSILGRDPESAVVVPDNAIRLDDILCPRCGTPLHMFAYPGTGRVIEGCARCKGVWIDREDLEEIRSLPSVPPRAEPAQPEAAVREAPPKPEPATTETEPPAIDTVPVEAPPTRPVVRERIRYSEKYGLGFSKLLLQSNSLRVDQQIPHWAESKLHLVVSNSYRIRSLRGSTLGWVEEHGEGLRAMIRRTLQRRNRPFVMHVAGSVRRELVLEITREAGILRVKTPDYQLGSVVRQGEGPPNGWDLLDGASQRFASVRFHPRPPDRARDRLDPTDWKFPIIGETGAGQAGITKKWAGTWKETTTDSDNFRIDFGTGRWTPEQRAVIFSAVFAIDFDLFEDDNPGDGPA